MLRSREQLIFSALLFALFAFLAFSALSFPPRARLFPLTVSVVSLALIVLDFFLTWRRSVKAKRNEEVNERQEGGLVSQAVKIAPYLAWILGLYLAIYLLGFLVASGLFVFSFLVTQAQMRVPFALISAAAVVGGILLLGNVLSLEWPLGLLPQALGFGRG